MTDRANHRFVSRAEQRRYQEQTGVPCPRAKSDMTPCVEGDGELALADDKRCIGCGLSYEGKFVVQRDARND